MIHQDIIRAKIQHGATNLQDAYRTAWMAGIPRHLRKPSSSTGFSSKFQSSTSGKKAAAVSAMSRAERRATYATAVMELVEQDMPSKTIARQLGIGVKVVDSIIGESGGRKRRPVKKPWNLGSTAKHDANMRRAHELRQQGLTWAQVSKAMGRKGDWIGDEYRAWIKAREAQQ